jgi:triphosphoribosyl-dephospho-CoA synthase
MTAANHWIAQAYLDACRVELLSLKPGNVHALAEGHRMTVADFEASARASAPVMAEPGLSVGMRIHEAIRRTRNAVGCNTNLGIVLLSAPLAAAAMTPADTGLRDALGDVLAGLDRADAEQAFAAIRLAAPAGLGEVTEHDVRRPATVTLRAAMAAARERDRIARQYATGFHDVFELGLPRLAMGLARWCDIRWATTSAYLGFLSAFPDSHIVRKFGIACAEETRHAAWRLDAELLSQASPGDMTAALMAFDAALKDQGVNPGTSADLTVASLFALRLEIARAAAELRR